MVTGMSSSQLLSQKAEFEMRRAVHSRELEDLAGKGEKLQYKGTTIVTSSTANPGSSGGGCNANEAMSRYILDQVKPSTDDLKNMKK